MVKAMQYFRVIPNSLIRLRKTKKKLRNVSEQNVATSDYVLEKRNISCPWRKLEQFSWVVRAVN